MNVSTNLYVNKQRILFFYLLHFIGVQLFYNVLLVSTAQQSESAIHIHIPPSLNFFPTEVTTEHWVPCTMQYSHQLSMLHIISIPVSQFIPRPLSPWYPYICPLHLCLYFCSVNKTVYIIFSIFHINGLIYTICFSLSDLLHSIQSLDSSTSLQMTQFNSFLGPSKIQSYVCTFFFILFSIIVYHRTLTIVPCAPLNKRL